MKFIIKFEQGVLEQTFKLSEMDVTDGINGVFQLLDEEFVSSVVSRFKAMNNDFHLAYRRHEV